jgi:hypothetical protein
MWSQVLSWHNSKYIKTSKEKSLYKHLQFLMKENQTLKAAGLEPIYIAAD